MSRNSSYNQLLEITAAFDKIIAGTLNPTICHDAFGLVVQVGFIEQLHYVTNKDECRPQSAVIRFKIKDARGLEVTCFAIGDSCHQFLSALRLHGHDVGYNYTYGLAQMFCVLRLWMFNDHGGEPGLTSQYGCSRVFINPDFNDIDYQIFMVEYVSTVVPYETGEVVDEN